ncbi:amidohydrolase family protein [Novosphingobium sp. YAF33]|uniref:amidohydrolase family protein n=1 Tax=Novosphingobium sp. YAF33 TaxID=3233082 RepID=UPI003F95ACFA
MLRSFIGSLAVTASLAAFPVQAETLAIVNAHILTPGPVGEVDSGTIVVRDGVIAAAGKSVIAPSGARIIDAQGHIVTPGLVAVNTALGLAEVSSVSGTRDDRNRNKQISAAFDVQYGLNGNSTLIPVARLGGVTSAIVVPGYDDRDEDRQLPFGGQAAAISLGQGARLLLKARVGMVLEFGEDGATRAGGSRAAEFVELRSLLDNAKFYRAHKAAYDSGNLRDLGLSRPDLEALLPVLDGTVPLIVDVHRASDIAEVLRLAKEYRLRVILSGAEETWMVASEIAAARVPVLLNPTANIPQTFELLGATLENARRLSEAGVEIAVEGNDGGPRVRDLRYNAGIAVSRGLAYAKAIEAVTLAPARIFGLDSQVGSIASGKRADLVIWSGDPLEPLSEALRIFVDGQEQPLTSRAEELRDRYLD